MSQAQVIAAILVRNRKLEFPPGTPEDYKVPGPVTLFAVVACSALLPMEGFLIISWQLLPHG